VVRRHDARDHAIAYTSETPPEKLPGEDLTKQPIKIILSSTCTGEDELKPTSRINFSKAFTIEHNIKVKKIGEVASDDFAWVKRYWKECMNLS
jgi:hypothetical protein